MHARASVNPTLCSRTIAPRGTPCQRAHVYVNVIPREQATRSYHLSMRHCPTPTCSTSIAPPSFTQASSLRLPPLLFYLHSPLFASSFQDASHRTFAIYSRSSPSLDRTTVLLVPVSRSAPCSGRGEGVAFHTNLRDRKRGQNHRCQRWRWTIRSRGRVTNHCAQYLAKRSW